MPRDSRVAAPPGHRGEQACRYTARQPFCVRFAGRPIVPRRPREYAALAIEFLREQFLGSSSLPKSRRRIYVSRANASGRKIANEEEILPILTSRGFVCSELEEMSLSAQIELFSKAEAVVAPHGAGLTNLVWYTPHTKVPSPHST